VPARRNIRVDGLRPIRGRLVSLSPLGQGTAFRVPHRTDIAPEQGDQRNQHQGPQHVEAVRNRGHEDPEGVHFGGTGIQTGEAGLDETDLAGHPSRNKRQPGHGRRGRIGQIGQFLARDPQAIRQGPQRGAQQERVRVVVKKDGQSQQPGHDLAAASAASPRREQLDHSQHAARAMHHPDHRAHQRREGENAQMSRIGQTGPQMIFEHRGDGPPRIAAGQDQRPQKNAGAQRKHHAARDDRQHDRSQRRQQA
jgi:hypothetical protein